jgi:lysophospholipase L1-like esterase
MFHCITWSFLVVVSVLAAEVGLRITGRVTIESVGTPTEEVFERIPGMFAPGQRVVERPRPELQYQVSINSLGYRGPEIDVEKRNGRIRVMCIGDSFTYGSYVDDDQTLPAHLERALRGARYPVDVINAGVGGTTIVDQVYVLRKSARIDVDIVLLVFTENDISDLAKDEPMYIMLEKNRKLKSRPGFRQVYALMRNTALFNLTLEIRGWSQGRGWSEADRRDGGGESYGAEALWKRYDRFLGEIQAYLADRGTRFVFVIFPSHFRMDPQGGSDGRIERVEGLAKRRGVRTINLLGPLRSSGYGSLSLYLLPYDGHPSSRGYSVAASAIARELERDVREMASRRR